VWILAALIGLGLYYYWLHSIHKTVPVLMVLMYLVVCALAGLLMAMVEHRPVVAAVSIAVMSAPFASTAAAAALYGAYVFHWLKL
jgi:RsiW-degrading membrane proteinase PrsW (M82 family)